jgi:uncharacterized spore protein YtfJ
MEVDVKDILKDLLGELRAIGKTEAVIGNEMKVGEFTIVPVSKISVGVGGGGSSGEAHRKGKAPGAGAGGGVRVEPVAFLVVRENKISLLSVAKGGVLKGIFESIPELITRLKGMKKKGEEEGKEEIEST